MRGKGYLDSRQGASCHYGLRIRNADGTDKPDAFGRKIRYGIFVTNLDYSYISSSGVKQIASFGGDISLCVPDFVEKLVNEKYGVK